MARGLILSQLGHRSILLQEKQQKIVVDVDVCELSKFEQFGLDIDCLILQDLRSADLHNLNQKSNTPSLPSTDPWLEQINAWKNLL